MANLLFKLLINLLYLNELHLDLSSASKDEKLVSETCIQVINYALSKLKNLQTLRYNL